MDFFVILQNSELSVTRGDVLTPSKWQNICKDWFISLGFGRQEPDGQQEQGEGHDDRGV